MLWRLVCLCFRHAVQTICSIIFAPVVYFMVGFSTADSGFRFFTFMVTGNGLEYFWFVILQRAECCMYERVQGEKEQQTDTVGKKEKSRVMSTYSSSSRSVSGSMSCTVS